MLCLAKNLWFVKLGKALISVRKLMKKFLLLMILFAMPFSATADSDSHKYIRAEIYYVNWNIRTRIPLSIDSIRRNYDIKTIIQDQYEINKFVKSLPLDELSPVQIPVDHVDARLVIDLIESDGSMETYVASYFTLYSSDLQRELEINEEFRARFRLNLTGSSVSN